MDKRPQPTLAEYLRASTKAAGVPLRVTDKAVLVALARLLRRT